MDDPDAEEIYPWGHPPHQHSYGQLVMAICGHATFSVEGPAGGAATYLIDPATAIWIPPFVWHGASFSPQFVPAAHCLDLDDTDEVRTLAVDGQVREELLAANWQPGPELPLTRAALAAPRLSSSAPPPLSAGPARALAEHLDQNPADPRDPSGPGNCTPAPRPCVEPSKPGRG